MSGTKVRCKFSVRRREPSPVGETVVAPLQPIVSTTPRTSRTARMLALAHYIERLIDAGDLKDYADAARSLGVTRARITQVAALTLLAPDVQERVLVGEQPVSARVLRRATALASWEEQVGMVERATRHKCA